jgi:nucleotide-binding universal stress UspA family protein
MIRTRIVVGVDGSDGSAAAVRWAATEARLRDAELRVVTAYHRLQPVTGGAARPAVDEEAAAIVHAAVMLARSTEPAIEVRGVALAGYAVPVLLQAERDDGLLVVGCRADRGFPGMPHGSVSGQVATHARGPVVVVRGHGGSSGGPVVVGVGDGPSTPAIVTRAFEQAALHGAPVLAVTAGDAAPEVELDLWREKFPDVPAEHEVVPGRPEQVLLDRCRQARVVVVGPRRHGFEGLMLGPVGTELLQRADCPVLVAR